MKATILIVSGLCSLLSLTSCNSSKTSAEESLTDKSMTVEKKAQLLKEGYTYGTIVHSLEEGDCEWTIKLEDGRHFESLTMNEDFKKENMEVYFKYIPQRRMSKCTKASPIEITEMVN